MPNSLEGADKQLLVMGLEHLRQSLFPIPQYTSYKYNPLPGGHKSTVEVPVPTDAAAPYDIAPSAQPKQAEDYTQGQIQIPCDRYKGRDFYLTDIQSIESGVRVLPDAAQAQINSIGAFVVSDIYNVLYQSTYSAVGAIGTIPFSTAVGMNSLADAKRQLKKQLTPMMGGDLRALITEEAEAKASVLRAFQDASYRGQQDTTLLQGSLPQAMNVQFHCPQVIPDHIAGTAAGWATDSTTHAAGRAFVGDNNLEQYEIRLNGGTGAWNAGDIFTVAGDSQTYVVKSWNTGTQVLNYWPAPKVAWANSSAVTRVYGDHRPNVVYNRKGIAFVTRPLESAIAPSLRDKVAYGTAYDALTGLTLALEIDRQNNQTRYEYKILYGVKSVRPEWGVRLLE